MQSIEHGYRSLGLLLDLNRDRALYVTTTGLALGAGAWIGAVFG